MLHECNIICYGRVYNLPKPWVKSYPKMLGYPSLRRERDDRDISKVYRPGVKASVGAKWDPSLEWKCHTLNALTIDDAS